MKYVLDTNTVIYFFKEMGNVASNLFQYRPEEIAIPSIVLYELKVGILKSNSPTKRIAQLEIFLKQVRVLPFTDTEANVAAFIRADLEKKGMPIGPYDTLIAATALANQATLVTHNTAEFSRITDLPLTDWF